MRSDWLVSCDCGFQSVCPLIGGFPCGSADKESACNAWDLFDPWVGRIPWRRRRLPTPVFGPREFHRLYSPWGSKESDMTRGLWKLPDGRDWLKLGLVLMGWAMSSKSLIQFSVDEWGCIPSLLFTWGQTMVELWNEVCDIVQETRIKTIPKKKKCKKAK